MKSLLLTAGLVAVLSEPGPAVAQVIPAEQGAAIAAELAKVVETDGPGCVVGVKRIGSEPTIVSRGLASIELGQGLSRRSVFDIASNAKQLTAAVILQMTEEGKLSLDDEIQRHLPDFPRFDQPVTLYHLLHHTSGLRDFDSLRMLSRTEDETTVTTDDVAAVIWRQKGLNFPPGSDFAYSNTNYVLLARIAEKIDGRPYPQILERRVFSRLGLRGTRQKASYADVVEGRTTPYVSTGEGPRQALANWTVYGTGSVYSNVDDMLAWLEMLMAPTPDWRDVATGLLQSGRLADGSPLRYAAGLVGERYRGVDRFFHNGGSAGYRSTLMIYPKQRLATAVLCNSGSVLPNHLSDRIADAVLSTAAEAYEPTSNPIELAPGGLYYSSSLDSYRWLDLAEGGVRVRQTSSDPGRIYRREGSDVFVEPVSGSRLTINGRLVTLDDNLKHVSRFNAVTPSPAAERARAQIGDYRSDEVDTRLAIREDSEGPYIAIAPVEPFMRASDTIERRLERLPDGAWVSGNGWVVRFPARDRATISIGRLVKFPVQRQAGP